MHVNSLGQLYLSVQMQRQGIGTRVLQMLKEEARRAGKPITLGVVKINSAPAPRALGLSAHARRPAQGLYAAPAS
jgi:GNAT superfamily N-acetyltransferase